MDQNPDMSSLSFFALVKRMLALSRRLYGLEKEHVARDVLGTAKKGLPWAGLAVCGLVFLALGGLCLLVTLILVLNTWFMPWASALIVTLILVVTGGLLVLAGVLSMRKKMAAARAGFGQVGEDLQCLRER